MPALVSAPDKKSFSKASWPILACNSFRSTGAGDADSPPAAAVGEDVDAAGAGIDGVFNQFLHDARGAFDHFAGGDAVDDLFGELADGHGRLFESIRG